MADLAMAQADELDGGTILPLTQSGRFGMTYMYQWDDSGGAVAGSKANAEGKVDIFTPANLKRWCKLEGFLISQDDYSTSFCKMDNSTCSAPRLSVVNFFYAHATSPLAYVTKPPDALTPAVAAGCPLLAQGVVDARRAELFAALKSDDVAMTPAPMPVRVFFGFFVGKGATATSASKTRSTIEIGQPLRGFASEGDEKTEQKNLYMKFYGKVEEKLWEEFDLKPGLFRSVYADRAVTAEGVDVIFFSFGIQQNEFPRVVNGDLMWASGSIMFVFAYMWARAKSCPPHHVSLYCCKRTGVAVGCAQRC